MLAADIPSLHSMLAVDPNGDSEVKGDAEAKGDADVQPRPSLSVTFPDESTVRASNASPLERSVPLVPELLTRNAPIKSVAVANIAARRLTRACSAAKIDLSSVSSRRKSGEDPSSRRKSGEDPEATFQDVMQGIWATTEKFQQDKKLITRQIRERDKRIINPRTSKWMPYWDFISFTALLFTAVATPIEVCFVNDGEVGWFIINLLVNMFFIVDMIMNFFMAYQMAPNKGGVWVTDRHTIVRHYLSTWFMLDLLTVIDFQLIGKGKLVS